MRWTTASPDGTNELTVWLDEAGALRFDATRRGRHMVNAGTMGVVRADASFASGLSSMATPDAVEVSETYKPAHGKRSSGGLHAMQRTLTFRTDEGNWLDVIVAATNDGLAFRYSFPGDNPAPLQVVEELTSFQVGRSGRAWLQPAQEPGYAAPAYENLYLDGVDLDEAASCGRFNLPALFETPDGWLLLAESDLAASYAGMRISRSPAATAYAVVLPDAGEGAGVGEVKPSHSLPWTLPWRVMIMADNPGEIAASDLVDALARPPQRNFSWVRPGRASWSWWSEHDSPQYLGRLRAYVDLAYQFGWEYTLVDANWDVHPPAAIAELVSYAAQRGVGVFLWYNSGGPHNTVTERPRDRMADPVARRAEMDKLVEWGVVGIKVDFFHSDKQAAIQLYFDIARDAAERRLMVNFHGCTVPRGWSRTWPNIMTMEAVAGAEQYAFRADYPALAPRHNTILPFTRNVVGPMDYTPVTFSDQRHPHATTNAHELALAIIFESGIQHLADAAESYQWAPEPVRAFLSSVPATWDDTVVLDGAPGDYVVMARRKGAAWFIAGISGREEPLPLLVGLSMIDRPSIAHSIHDGARPDEYSWDTHRVMPHDAHEVVLASRGGFVLWVTPE